MQRQANTVFCALDDSVLRHTIALHAIESIVEDLAVGHEGGGLLHGQPLGRRAHAEPAHVEVCLHA